MARVLLAITVPFLVLCACGGGDAGSVPSDDAAAPGAAVAAEAPDEVADGQEPGWTVTLEEAEGAPDLPDIEGDDLDASRIGTTLQLSGIDPDHALTVRVTVGEEVATGDYGPSTFSITWPATDHTCVGGADGVTISVEGLEPVRGTLSGEVRCYTASNPTEAFTAQLSGTFLDTL